MSTIEFVTYLSIELIYIKIKLYFLILYKRIIMAVTDKLYDGII